MVRVALTAGIIGLILGGAALGYALYTGLSQFPSQLSSLTVNQAPQTRNVVIEWEATLPSLQDRWFPQAIVVNQGDTMNVTLEVNDTDGAHTFTIYAPTGSNGATQLTQLNSSVLGQWIYYPPKESGPMYGTEVTQKASGCYTMGTPVTCNTVGGCAFNGVPYSPPKCVGSWMEPNANKLGNETASIQASVVFGPLITPGVYEYMCLYHQKIGMVGYLIVLPNKGYTG
jgi:plastocyanin